MKMASHDSGLAPRWASPPGATLRTAIQERGFDDEAVAAQLELDNGQLQDLIDGRLEINVRIARSLTESVGGSPEFWLTREAQFRDDLLRVAADKWTTSLPLPQMKEWGWVPRTTSWHEDIANCLAFFGSRDLGEFEARMGEEVDRARYRTSETFDLEAPATAVWFRACEMAVEDLAGLRVEYSPELFTAILHEAKELTRSKQPEVFVAELVSLCATAGVALAVVRAPKGCPASGAARWCADRPLIQLSARHLSDDHFWFSFFHEAGHVLMHELSVPFVDVLDEKADHHQEAEANEFAADWLMAQQRTIAGRIDRKAVARLAAANGVSSGVVVGQLQHSGRIRRDHFNTMKRYYKWNGLTLESRQRR